MMIGNIEYVQAYTEVNCLLTYFPTEYIKKLPNKLLVMIQEKSDEKYNIVVDMNKDLESQNISKKAKDILVVLKYLYWSDESEKENLKKTFYENEKAFQEELSEKYNSDNLFKTKKLNEKPEESENVSMIGHKESWFSKLFKQFKKIFKK